jgi:hypothetical protein
MRLVRHPRLAGHACLLRASRTAGGRCSQSLYVPTHPAGVTLPGTRPHHLTVRMADSQSARRGSTPREATALVPARGAEPGRRSPGNPRPWPRHVAAADQAGGGPWPHRLWVRISDFHSGGQGSNPCGATAEWRRWKRNGLISRRSRVRVPSPLRTKAGSEPGPTRQSSTASFPCGSIGRAAPC